MLLPGIWQTLHKGLCINVTCQVYISIKIIDVYSIFIHKILICCKDYNDIIYFYKQFVKTEIDLNFHSHRVTQKILKGVRKARPGNEIPFWYRHEPYKWKFRNRLIQFRGSRLKSCFGETSDFFSKSSDVSRKLDKGS